MIEIIPKPVKKRTPLQPILFYFSLSFAVAIILSYLLLIHFENRSLVALQNIETKITQVGTPEEKETEAKLLALKKRIEKFTILFEERRKSSNFFEFLEEITHPQTRFSNLTLDLNTSQAIISGDTANFQTMGQQFLLFHDQELIQKVDLSDFSIGEAGGIDFTFSIFLDPKIFTGHKPQ